MILGDYHLHELVGRGGMGSVYRATHLATQQIVAIKLMEPDKTHDPLLFRRFEQEYAAASRLEHPHIVRAIDFGVQGTQPFLVMEFVEGRSVGQIVRNGGPMSETEAFRITREIADALHHAHENRLIHRDVKPDNILVTSSGMAKLADLGLVKDLDGGALTRPRSSLGTITFMAPEQFEGAEHVDRRADVYGLAGTLYFMLTGIVPFPGRGNLSVLQKKLRNEFEPARRFLGWLHPEVDVLLSRALDVNPALRPTSCLAFAAGLVQSQEAERDIRDRRVSPRYPSILSAGCWDAEHRSRGTGGLLDVSRTGLCLELNTPATIGETLIVEVVDRETKQTHRWNFVIRWTRPAAEGLHRLGGEFLRELTSEELDILLGSLPRTEKIQ